MVTMKKFCRVCGEVKAMTLQNPVPQKEDTYYFECDKGHIADFFVLKRSMEILKKESENHT